MTTKEQQTIENLFKVIQDLRTENSKFREDVKLQVEAINTKTEKKHVPITLEQDILRTSQIAINESIQKVLTDKKIEFTINRVGSMISVHFDKNEVSDFDSAKNGDNESFKKFFHGLLNQGVYIAPSAYETWFITDALSYEDLDATINAIDKVANDL